MGTKNKKIYILILIRILDSIKFSYSTQVYLDEKLIVKTGSF